MIYIQGYHYVHYICCYKSHIEGYLSSHYIGYYRGYIVFIEATIGTI
jgi:hypothetical protein